ETYATARVSAPLCNASRAPPRPKSRRPFSMPGSWRGICRDLPLPQDTLVTMAHWDGQNACWEWLKQRGCYEKLGPGAVTWREGQTIAASQSVVPFPWFSPMYPLRNPELCDIRENGAQLDATAEDIREATAWLHEHVAVYVLNLPADTLRLAAISARLDELNITFRRVAGVDLTTPEKMERAKDSSMVPPGFNFTRAQAVADQPFHGMGGIRGTVGCAAAHLHAMAEVLRRKPAQPLALILEDDVHLVHDFALKLRRLLEGEVPCDWSAVSLKSLCAFGECVSPHLPPATRPPGSRSTPSPCPAWPRGSATR
ncbi:unnamed protein product, partial [Prorocentrum cordatum]